MPDRPREEQLEGELNICIMDTLAEIFKRAAALGQGLAQRYGLSMTDLAGLHKLEEPMTMKELGQRMHCDPSFVTMVANGLEKRGLARRETSERDKRIKVMRLTDLCRAARSSIGSARVDRIRSSCGVSWLICPGSAALVATKIS